MEATRSAKLSGFTPTFVRLSRTTAGKPLNFVKEVVAELKKVTWPTRVETIRYTVMVIIISILVGAFVGGLDILFVRITSLLFKR